MNDKTFSATGAVRTHAERLAHEAAERLLARQQVLAEQHAIENPPEVRIRAWEKAHELRLPSDPEHPVLYEIAIRTGLTIAQVQDEQRARALRRAAKPLLP